MEWTQQLLDYPLLVGSIFIVSGIVMRIFPPKQINNFYGYRTITSMRSEERWHYAQKFSSLQMIIAGCALLALSTLGLVLQSEIKISVGVVLIVLAIIYLFITTETELKRKFPKTQ
ncbi:MAG TPA: SdpI family protein [Flavobacterium sp.]|jgi:uncharacterized membrane protein